VGAGRWDVCMRCHSRSSDCFGGIIMGVVRDEWERWDGRD
jgi:hypothetical protein